MAERRYTLVFAVAVLTAGAATLGVYKQLEASRAKNAIPTRAVVVAAQEIPEGTRIDRAALSVERWPTHTVPDSVYGVVDSVAGRVSRIAIFPGDPIVERRLAPPGSGPGIEVKIAPGKRAMAVKINDVVGLAGLIQPNSRVDVLVTLKEASTGQKQRAKVFMNNMRVLSVGTQVERGSDGKPINATTAALEVTPDEAERLAVAMNQGAIQLVLRGFGDPEAVQTKGATESDVLAQLRSAPERVEPKKPAPRRTVSRPAPPPAPVIQQVVAPPPPPKKPETHTVEVYRGTKVSQQKFEKDSTKP